jgi:hypothetical protein
MLPENIWYGKFWSCSLTPGRVYSVLGVRCRSTPQTIPRESTMGPNRPLVGRLKLMFQDMDADTCPLVPEDQVSQFPSKILEMLFRDFSPQYLGDMGTLVKVTDQRHYETITRIVQWITKGEAASFLVQHKPQVRKRNGDREYPRAHMNAEMEYYADYILLVLRRQIFPI